MKITKKILAFVMAFIISVTAFLPAYALSTEVQYSRPDLFDIKEYKQKIYDEGYPVITTEQFLSIANFFGFVKSVFTGGLFLPREKFNVTVDDFVTEACNDIYLHCGLDIVALLTNVPDINGLAELTVKVFQIDTATIKDQLYEKRDEFARQGNPTLAKACFFLGAYLSIIEECLIYAEPTEDPDVYEVKLKATFKDGGCEYYYPGIFINVVTGECSNEDGSGLVGTGFNFNLKSMLVYATIDSWMRNFGFCVFYDIAANSMPLLWNYVTRRFRFDYDGLEWMIQIWKGNYLITNGAEAGVYNRQPGSFGTFYNCASDDQLMEMSLQVYHNEELLVDQPPQMHWWINGFQMNSRRYEPMSLTMKFSIQFPNEEMLYAFTESIDSHRKQDVTYTIDGLTIYVTW